MEQRPRSDGVTVREVLAGLAALAILGVLIVPASKPKLFQERLAQVAANGRLFFHAASEMAEDDDIVGDETFGWPGELALRTGKGKIVTVKDYVERLLTLEYLSADDAGRILFAPGAMHWEGIKGTFSGEQNCAFKIYRVTKKDREVNLFAVTRNFTYGRPTLDYALPIEGSDTDGHHSFIAIHMAGDAAVYREEEALSLGRVGRLPGRREWRDGDQETPDDSLVQQ